MRQNDRRYVDLVEEDVCARYAVECPDRGFGNLGGTAKYIRPSIVIIYNDRGTF